MPNIGKGRSLSTIYLMNSRKLVWTDEAWKDYLHWQSQDKKTLKRINKLIQATKSLPFDGIGKPEPLRETLWLLGTTD
ncbi:Toxin YoeB [Acaryochloris thomasi RCC1774]|uniref:Endoribonuclease YoeB n=1 Tax=Acaryochloris thomasi RCC1774 TaxID=1764569 RepID=A0A2W1JGD9_9CYAN|nr:Toxin YoeB [Acaryochloris thomasi RCC1774]